MKNLTKQQIISNLPNLSEKELRDINSALVDILKANRKFESSLIKSKLTVGATVTVNHPKAVGEYTVFQINRTKAILNPKGSLGRVVVPISLINA